MHVFTHTECAAIQISEPCPVEPALKDRPIGHKNMVSQDRWLLVTGSVALKGGTFCQEYVVEGGLKIEGCLY